MSTSAGFVYSGRRFAENFADFIAKYGFGDMYSAGFYPYATLEEYWAYWSRYIYINRYQNAPKPVYENLLKLVQGKDYFVLTTNVDHCFQKAGLDKHRLFYTQGDYGLWQCSKPCHSQTYDNEETVCKMLEAQGLQAQQNGLKPLANGAPKTCVPTQLVPHCPVCGAPMAMNLRADGTFVQDEGWYKASERYHDFIRRHEGLRMLYLELGVGANTPGIIKYPFWQMTYQNPKAVYGCINLGEAFAPREIQKQAICINADIAQTIACL